jgi:phage FluMu protein Com
MIDIRCLYCNKLHCRISGDFDVVQFRCPRRSCRKMNAVSPAIILKQAQPDSAILPSVIKFPLRTSAQ